ncbi:unnamed protein product [Dimorphilus gyrociliatus]|uniref:RING-type domain-containing protein n=1 Tax=Dimorphilus gyrociliatus TaxID=2664684 RepID=A0A7I8VG68_9ANNE|nr:unnamed protein product [Dimorphilus gyrociliatus]
MATDSLQFEESALVCSLCLDFWVENDPRVLPCQHTFCFQCLKMSPSNILTTCPVCRTKVNIRKENISNLPKNILANSLKESSRMRLKNTTVCKEHNQVLCKPKLVCKTCKEYNICEECLNDSHKNCQIRLFEHLNRETRLLKKRWEPVLNRIECNLRKNAKNFKMELNEIEMKFRKNFIKIRNELERKEETELNKIKLMRNRLKGEFYRMKDLEREIENFKNDSKFSYTIPNVEIELNLSENCANTRQNKVLVKIQEFHNLDCDISFTDIGIIKLYSNQNNQQYFRIEFENSEVKEIPVNHTINTFAANKNFIYTSRVHPYISLTKCSINSMADGYHFEIIDNFYELVGRNIGFIASDNDYDSFLYIFAKFGDLYFKLYKNGEKIWYQRFKMNLVDCCFLNNGNILLAGEDYLQVLHKDNGEKIFEKNTQPKIQSITSVPNNGFMLTRYQEQLIYIYNDCFHLSKTIEIDFFPSKIQMTNSFKLLIQNLDCPLTAVLYKYI